MWRTSSPTVNTSCADGEGLDSGRSREGGGSLERAGEEFVVRERDCSARMSAGVTSDGGSGVTSKREGAVGRAAGLRERVRRRSAKLGTSSGIVETILVLRRRREWRRGKDGGSLHEREAGSSLRSE